MDYSIFEEKSRVKKMGLSLFSQLDNDTCTAFVAKTVYKERVLLIISTNFLTPEYVVYLCKPIIPSSVE